MPEGGEARTVEGAGAGNAASVRRTPGAEARAAVATLDQASEERLRRQNAYLAALHTTTLDLMHRRDIGDLLHAIVARAGELVDCPHGYVYLAEPDGSAMVLRVGVGRFAGYVGNALKPGEGLSGEVWQSGLPLVVGDYSTFARRRTNFAPAGFCAVVGVPLSGQLSAIGDQPSAVSRQASGTGALASPVGRSPIADGSVTVGVIGLAHSDPSRGFTDDEVEILSRFAELASVALDNARLDAAAQSELAERRRVEAERTRLLEAERAARAAAEAAQRDLAVTATQLDRALAEAELLNAITTASAGEDDLDRILAAALAHLGGLVRFTGGSIILIEGDELVIRAAVGPFAERARGQRLARNQGPSWRVVETGRPYRSGDVAADGFAPTTPFRSFLAVPLIWRGGVFGLLEIDSTEPRAFAERDVALLQRVATALSGSIELARRYASEVEALARAMAAQARIGFQARLLDAVEQAVIATDLDGRITYWNGFAERLYGWLAGEVLGRNILDVTPTDQAREEAASVMERLRAGESWCGELTVRRRDGTEFLALVTDAPVLDGLGQLTGIVGVSTDITERRREEAAQRFLAEASRLLAASLDYETTLDSVAHLVVPRLADWCFVDLLNPDGVPQRLVTAHADPVLEARAREVERRYPPKIGEATAVGQVLRAGRSILAPEVPDAALIPFAHDAEHLALLRSLGLRSAMIVALVVRGRTVGAITFASAESGRRYTPEDLAVAEDLAHRAAVAVDNARLYREAQQAIRARDEFLSVAAHELKTPVTSLRGFAQLLVRQFDRDGRVDPDRLRQRLRIIDEQSVRLTTLVSQLLDVSRIESGKLVLARRPTDLVALTARAVSAAQGDTSRHTLALEAPPTLEAEVDPIRVEQVLVNLLDNAVKYSPDGGAIEVEVGLSDAATAAIRVRDHGVGIPSERREQIFDRFYQAHGHDQFGGMGLGLYISRQIVELHGGRIEVESPDGPGSRFVVTLPLVTTPPLT